MGFFVNSLHHIPHMAIGQNGKQGAKDFFLHDSIIPSDVIQNSRCDTQFTIITLTTPHILRGMEQILQPLEVFFVDDFAIIGIFQRMFSKLF